MTLHVTDQCEGLWWDIVTLHVTGQSVRDCGRIL